MDAPTPEAVELPVAVPAVPDVDTPEAVDVPDAVPVAAAVAAPVAATEADGTTALHWAAENDNDVLVGLLLAAGANAHSRAEHGFGASHWAHRRAA